MTGVLSITDSLGIAESSNMTESERIFPGISNHHSEPARISEETLVAIIQSILFNLTATTHLENGGLQSMLGNQERLRKLTRLLNQHHDHSTNHPLFSVSNGPCSSVLVTVKSCKREISGLQVLALQHSTIKSVVSSGNHALTRYQNKGGKYHLDRSNGQIEFALDIKLLERLFHTFLQSNTKLIHRLVVNPDIFIDTPLSSYRSAVASRIVESLRRPSALTLPALEYWTQLQHGQHDDGTTPAEQLLDEGTSHHPSGNLENASAISLPQKSLMEHEFISGSADENSWTAGAQLLHCFEHCGDLPALQQAISMLEASVNSSLVSDHPRYLACLADLGVALWNRFIQHSELRDLEKAISCHKVAVDLAPDGHLEKATYLNNLSLCLATRFQCLVEQSDLDQAISGLQDALHIAPAGSAHRVTCLGSLGKCIGIRYECFERLDDLEEAISMLKEAVDLTPDGHSDKPRHLNNLGRCFRSRFRRIGKLSDADQAISSQMHAVDLSSDDNPYKPNHLIDLGVSLMARFSRFGESSDVEQAINICRVTARLIPNGHFHKPRHLHLLGFSLLSSFSRFGDRSYFEEAISRLKAAVDLTPDSHLAKPRYLSVFCYALSLRLRASELDGLEQAISGQMKAVELTRDRQTHKHHCIWLLGVFLLLRFGRLGELCDLEQAICLQREAVFITPDDHSRKAVHLRDLGDTLCARYRHFGELADLEEAISMQRAAVELIPNGYSNTFRLLWQLAHSLYERSQILGEQTDLEEAISRYKDAVELMRDNDIDKPCLLNDFCYALIARFSHTGEPGDLERAISNLENVVDSTPDNDMYKPSFLDTLASYFIARFQHLEEPSDLEQAIVRQRKAADLVPEGHPHNMAKALTPLGNYLRMRFERFSRIGDLEEAISFQKVAVELTPECHPKQPSHLEGLANSFKTRFQHGKEPGDLEQAISMYAQAARASVGPTTIRFRASQEWISCALLIRHDSLLEAYSVAIGLLPQLAWIGLPLTQRYNELVQGADVAREAAAAALDAGQPTLAVEWLEQGRSIVWGELFQLRSSYDELSSAHPDHARKLRELSFALERASATCEQEQEADRHRALAIQRDKLLQEIRRSPGFERFLLHKQFSQLRVSAHSGPVVILSAAERRCDALIVLYDQENVLHVPLPGFIIKRSVGLQNALDMLLGPARVTIPCDRDGWPASRHNAQWESMLSTLWKGVVKPVLDTLGLSTPGNSSRIFWCPTGPFTFLPIHAAGLYGTQYSESGHKVFDHAISSYVPTLSVLTPSIRDNISSGPLRVLAVPQSPSDGQTPLPGVHIELGHIRAAIRNSEPRAELLEASVGTVEEVLGLMKDADWVHFACHGVQDPENPSNSGLCLADKRRLKLSDMTSLSRTRGGLAFLSACQTAMGDKKLSDEAVHIAAGMLFAGYGGVIGTMWSISDRVAPRVARDVYEQLFGHGTTPDYRKAAEALHNAVGRLRANNASFVEWVPFIHVGM